MSRYNDADGDEEEFQNAYAFYRTNADRALKGKRGRKVLAELRDALLALPEKRLISGAMCTVDTERRKAEYVGAYPQWEWRARDFDDSLDANNGVEGVCAIGAYLWHRRVKAGMDPAEAFDALPTLAGYDDDGLHRTAEVAASEANIVYSLAWSLAYRNDETFDGLSPEERYSKFLAWLDSELGAVKAAS